MDNTLTRSQLIDLCRDYLGTLPITLWSRFFELHEGDDGIEEAARWFADQIEALIRYKNTRESEGASFG